MKIDYFNDGSRPIVDRSDWFASITCLSGVLNGALTPYGLGIDCETSLPSKKQG